MRIKETDLLTLDTGTLAPHLTKEDIKKGMPGAIEALGSLLKGEGPGCEMLGWLALPCLPARDIEEITDAGRRIQDQSDCLIVVGIGGSYLGARAGIEALGSSAHFPVLFAGNNLSPEYHSDLLDYLEGKRFSICAISKSGTTTEPAIAFRLLRNRLIELHGREGCNERIVAITDPVKGALRQMAREEGWKIFPIPPDVGGRFSVLSPVGLLPLAAAGIPIDRLVAGACKGLDRWTREEPGNEALRYATARSLLHGRGIEIEVLSTFHPELAYICEWWKQLAGESEGKEGKGLYPSSTVMTADLHSLGQLLQEGSRKILETFLISEKADRDIEIPGDADDLDGLNYIAGKSLSEVNRMAYEGTKAAHVAGGLPVMTIRLERIDPESIGALFIFYELAIAVSGRLIGVNPFNQPGVEEYKNRMFKLLGKPGY
jgi:glucose-6-phosphate isomerase